MNYKVKNYLRELSHKNKLLKWLYKQANKSRVNITSNWSDEDFAKWYYKQNTGKELNLDNPKTFDEKLWWLKLNNRDPLLTTCSDKYLVRAYVEKCGLGHILNELYGVYDNADQIDYNILPNRFFLKCNHVSDGNILCSNKSIFDREKAKKKLNNALKSNYYFQSREWNYKNIKPRIICERVLESPNNSNTGLLDYRFLCFDGVAKCLFIDIDTCKEDGSHRSDARRNVYDMDFRLLDVIVSRTRFPVELAPKPANFDEMRSYAEILSRPFPHSRVDLYNINGRIYFGEITFYHAGACNKIYPEEWELIMGDWINLSQMKQKNFKY